MAVTIAETGGHVTETALKSPLSPPVTMRRNDRSHSPKYALCKPLDACRVNYTHTLASITQRHGWRFPIGPRGLHAKLSVLPHAPSASQLGQERLPSRGTVGKYMALELAALIKQRHIKLGFRNVNADPAASVLVHRIGPSSYAGLSACTAGPSYRSVLLSEKRPGAPI